MFQEKVSGAKSARDEKEVKRNWQSQPLESNKHSFVEYII